jgi:hypothetical protein
VSFNLNVADAINLACHAHAGQTDEGGLPHIVHAVEVMVKVKEAFEQNPVEGFTLEELMIAAVLHDVIEDSDYSFEKIHNMFGANIACIVDGVSRRKDESYRDFIYRAKINPASRLVKICDLRHNRSRTHKIAASKASWRGKLEYKYRIASAVLEALYEPTWEGASYEVRYEDSKTDTLRHARYYIADPNGRRIEVPEAEAKNIKISFTLNN